MAVLRAHLIRSTVLCALLVALALPALARANAYDDVSNAFVSHGGTIPACLFKASTLHAALGEVPTESLQYDAALPDAIQQAMNQQVDGVCHGGTTATTTSQATAPIPGVGGGRLPSSATSATAAGVPLTIVLLGVLVALFALAVGIRILARRSGSQPVWLQDWRHACAEAEYRIGGRWAEFRDRRRKPPAGPSLRPRRGP